MGSRQVFTGPHEDRLALRELTDRYSDAVNRQDADAWAATWAEDAVWGFRGTEIVGRETILATWQRAMAGFEMVWFQSSPGHIDVRGDEAELRTHTFEYLKPKDAPVRLQTGLYTDRARRLATGWHFSQRLFSATEIKL